MLTALDHVILAVRDLDVAAADYSRLLGLAPSWRGEHPGSGTANVLFRLENTYLELLSPKGDGAVGALLESRLRSHGEGLGGLAFATDDIEACRSELLSKGLDPGPVEAGLGCDTASGAERRWRRVSLSPALTRGLLIFPIQHDGASDVLPASTPSGKAEASVHALDHAVVQTHDGDGAAALFGGALGLRLALDRHFPDWGVRLMFFRVGGVTIEVAAALGNGDTAATALPGAEPVSAGHDHLYGLSYRVGSADAARERLAEAGVDVSPVRVGRRPGTRVFTVRSGTCGVPTLMLELDGQDR